MLGCRNNLRQISIAVTMYLDDNNGYYPMRAANTHGASWPTGAQGAGGPGGWGSGWGGLFYYHHYLYAYLGAKIPPGGVYNSLYVTPAGVFRCPKDKKWGARPDDISYGMVIHGAGVNASFYPTEPTYTGSQMRMINGTIRSYWVNANGTLGGAFWGGPDVPGYGPYLIPDEAAAAYEGSTPYTVGGTVLRHGLTLPYLSADLSVRTADLAGSNYAVGFYNPSAGLPGGDPTGGWYRVIPFITGPNPYAKGTVFSSSAAP